MIEVKDKKFEVYISEEKIQKRVSELAKEIATDYAAKDPIVIGVLNGSLYFLTDLTKQLNNEVELALVRYQSYRGTQSSGGFIVSLPFDDRVSGRDVLLVEDIVDTGATMNKLQADLEEFNPKSVEVITLFLKPEVFQNQFPVKYIGFEIPEKFILGYGLDYDGRGRNLRDIYVLSE